MWSYVDNWELFGTEVAEVVNAYASLEAVCVDLDLSLDKTKTCTWALDGASRQELRSEGLNVQRNFRDLGGHQQFSRQQTNGTLKSQCERLQNLWPALARSLAPYNQKLKVVRCKAWPRGLHAASGVHISPNIFKTLRAGAGKGLRADKAGSSSHILLSLVHFPSHDPGCYAILDAVVQFRRFADPVRVEPYLHQASQIPDSLRVPGPCGVLIARLETLGWIFSQGTLFLDQDHLPVDVMHSPLREVQHRICRAWRQHVGSIHAFRHGFEGFHQVDAVTTAKHLEKLSFESHAPIRSLLTGVFITADQQGEMFKVDGSERVCKFCHAQDSLEHRHWDCPHTAASRALIPAQSFAVIQSQPQCFRVRGWCIEHPSVQVFRQSLFDIPDLTANFHFPEFLPESFDCFTDGAASDPNQPGTRLATWGWVLGDFNSNHFWPVSEGGVSGLWQTVARAEICSVLSVVRFVKIFPRRTRIWCDNQLVVDRMQQLLDDQLSITFLLHDHDLWSRIAQEIRNFASLVTVHKVYSHQDPTALSEEESWIVKGNHAADATANHAFQILPEHVKTSWQIASGECFRLSQAHKHMLEHMARVAFLSIQFGKVPLVDATPEPYDLPSSICLAEVVRDAKPRLNRSFVFTGDDIVFGWLASIEQQSAPLRQVSFSELLIAFQLATGCIGVENIYTTKHNHRQWRLRSHLNEYSFGVVNRSFSAFCCSVIKLAKPGWKVTQGRSSSFRFQYWTGILVVALQPVIHQQIESWLSTHCGMTPFRKASDLSSLPFASGPPLT